jgi:hypothetical protein
MKEAQPLPLVLSAMEQRVPPIIHLVNLAALLLIGIILVLSAVARTYQLAILLPVLGLLIVYWRSRTNRKVVESYLNVGPLPPRAAQD